MPRAAWSGSISFGLVHIPIKLFVATADESIRFHLLHEKDGVRIRSRYVCPKDGSELEKEDLVKGYEIARDQYVTVTEEDLDKLRPETSQKIELKDFVSLSEIDSVYYEKAYYVVPDKAAAKAYGLLHHSMKEADKIGLGSMVMRRKEYLVALRPRQDVLLLETMRYATEIKPVKDALEGAQVPLEEPDKRELDMGEKLIEALSSKFEPEKYHDTYQEKVMKFIEKRSEGEEAIVTAPQVAKAPRTRHLMEALEASLKEARKGVAHGSRKRK